MSDDSSSLLRGRFARFKKLAGLSAQLGTDAVVRGVRRLAGEDSSVLSQAAVEKLTSTLGELKGLAMKLGQVASLDPDALPPELRAVLARLQHQAPPMAFSQVDGVIRAAFGKPAAELFAQFDEAPSAAASLGQVHGAVLKDGRKVAVKVQYPGVADALTSDLDNLSLVARAISKTHRLLDGRAYLEEMQRELLAELDYQREAELSRVYGAAAVACADLRVPQIIDDHTAKTVLTLERFEGPTLKEVLDAGPSNEERFRLTRLLMRAVYGPFLARGVLHADPHPGNFVVLSDGTLGVLDFGSVKRFDGPFLEALRSAFKAAVAGKPIDEVGMVRQAGFTIDLPDEEARTVLRQMLQLGGKPLHTSDYDFAKDSTTWDIKKFFALHATKVLRIRPPAEAVMFFRAVGELTQVLRLIGARGDVGSVYRELATLVP